MAKCSSYLIWKLESRNCKKDEHTTIMNTDFPQICKYMQVIYEKYVLAEKWRWEIGIILFLLFHRVIIWPCRSYIHILWL